MIPKTVARIKPQYAENLGLQIISRSQQGPMSSLPQCCSASQHPTAAIRGNAPTSDPSWSVRARYGRRRMFQQRRRHLETILPPACGVGAASPLIAARSSPLHRSLSSPHVSLCGRVRRARKSRVCRQQHVNWETDSWVRVRLTASGTRDGRYAAARLGPAVDRCWRRRHSLEGASTSWLSAETRPVTFTRCGYAICIPRQPTIQQEYI
jgi:hypothetical protein